MLAAEDVVNLVREARVVFVDQAILAAFARPLGHLGSKFVVDVTRHEKGSAAPAPWPSLGCALTP